MPSLTRAPVERTQLCRKPPGGPPPPGNQDNERPGKPTGTVPGVIDSLRNVRFWFTPSRLRGQGVTPDYRFSLANERTFLAWLRTALALIGGGFAVDQFLPGLRREWRVGLALALLGAGALCSLRAVNHWVRCERAMRRGEDLPVTRFPALVSLVVAVVAVAMVIVVFVGRGK